MAAVIFIIILKAMAWFLDIILRITIWTGVVLITALVWVVQQVRKYIRERQR